MPVCLWCQAEVLYTNLPCPKCGKRQAEHPSMPPSGYASVRPPEEPPPKVPSLAPPAPAAGPKLDLPPASLKRPVPSKPPSPSPKDSMKAPPPDAGVGGALFDEDDDVFSTGSGGPINLELDMGNAPPVSIKAAPFISPLAAPVAGRTEKKASLRLKAEGPAQGQRDLSEEQIEARAFADYGIAPEAWWKTPLYAYRVWTRRAELRRMRGERKREADEATAGEENAYVSFAERARSVAEKAKAYGDAIKAIVAAEGVMGERDQALSREMETHKERLAAVDARIAGLEADLVEARASQARVEGELVEVDLARERAEVRLKRTEIELRNQAAPRAAGVPEP